MLTTTYTRTIWNLNFFSPIRLPEYVQHWKNRSRIWKVYEHKFATSWNRTEIGKSYERPDTTIPLCVRVSEKKKIRININETNSFYLTFINLPDHWPSGRPVINSRSRLKKMVLDTSLLNTQHYKVRIKGKVEQSRERSGALPYISVY